MKKVKELHKGDFFKKSENGYTVYIRGEYCKELKKYSCVRFDDCNSEIFLKGDKEVFVDFEF